MLVSRGANGDDRGNEKCKSENAKCKIKGQDWQIHSLYQVGSLRSRFSFCILHSRSCILHCLHRLRRRWLRVKRVTYGAFLRTSHEAAVATLLE
jgi:hypothetical protein